MQAKEAAMSAEGPDLSQIKRAPIVIALVIGAFVAILNETLLGNAFPDLIKALNVTPATIQWLSTAYMLVVGVLVPVTAILQEWFTTRQMFIGAMTFFLIGTIIAAVAPGFEVLLAGRVVQALGTGLMLPVMMNTILAIFPPEKRGGAMGLIGLVIMVAPAIGPTVSGLILDQLEWRWLFYLVIPLAAFSIIFASIYMKNVSKITKPKVDILSIILSTIGFGGVVYGFSKSGDLGWGDPQVYWMVAAGVLGILIFAGRQLMLKNPVMDMRAFKFPMFALVTVLMLVMMMTLFSTLTLLPMYLQGPLMLTAFTSGLIMLPGGIVNGLMAPVAGVLFDKLGPRVLVIPGLAIVVVAVYLFTGVDMETTKGYLIMVHIIMMVGISLVMMPAQTTALNQLPRELYPHGTAIMNTLQQVAGAIGVALFISIMSKGTKDYLAKSSNPTDPIEALKGMVEGLHNAFWVGFYIGVLALVIGLFIRRTKPPEGEEPRQGMGH